MANLAQTIQDFLTIQPTSVDISALVIALILSALFGLILEKVYIKYGHSLSNRRKLGSNFVLLTTTTTLIIFVVKSSLALSLGLIGALSIVRFRTPIKEPEELAFLFISIGMGLGFGANQIMTTTISFLIIALLIIGRSFIAKKDENQSINLAISGMLSKDLALKNIVEILKRHASSVIMRRFDQLKDGNIELLFNIELDSFEDLEKIKGDLNKLSKNLAITYLDKTGIY